MGVDHLHKEADHPHEIWSLDGSNQVDNQVENHAVHSPEIRCGWLCRLLWA